MMYSTYILDSARSGPTSASVPRTLLRARAQHFRGLYMPQVSAPQPHSTLYAYAYAYAYAAYVYVAYAYVVYAHATYAYATYAYAAYAYAMLMSYGHVLKRLFPFFKPGV